MICFFEKTQPSYIAEFASSIIKLPVEQFDQILIPNKEYLGLKSNVGYWQSMHKKAIAREEVLKQTVKKLEGHVRDLRHRVFGKKSEKKNSKPNEKGAQTKDSKRPRGQQSGSKGHGRTIRPDLPEKKEVANLPDNTICPRCNKPYIPDESAETEIIEVEVKAYKRKIIRKRVKKGCDCKGVPATIIAPMPPKIFPKSPYGISIWEAILLTKFHYCQPTNRLLNQYKELGLPISPGTIAGGLKNIKKLFEPVYNEFHKHQLTEDLFHNDESSWKVFENVEGKIGNKWWLWVSRSASVVYFQIAPGRGTNVPMEYFKNNKNKKIIVVCDRYSAYKSLARQNSFIILAFCWAHVRRDFLDAAKKHKELEKWALFWVDKIGELYHINNQRRKEFDPGLSMTEQSAVFNKHHATLVEKLDTMVNDRNAFLKANNPDNDGSTFLSHFQFKILTSLMNHWEGLTVFIKHPEVPMDNNPAEKVIRNPVTGRKNFYGSGSLWSSQLAAIMFSIFQTIALNGLNCNHWLRSYLTTCAENNGKPPKDLSPFLPWEMDKKCRIKFSNSA